MSRDVAHGEGNPAVGTVADAVAAAAALYGHDLRFVRQDTGQMWAICFHCRFSCRMWVHSKKAADRSMERWMLCDCGSLGTLDEVPDEVFNP